MDLKGKWALITGASSGIGDAFAKALAKQGCNLLLVARRRDILLMLASELIAQYGIEVDVIDFDLADTTSASELYIEVQKRSRTVDVLINNAGFGTFGPFDETAIHKNQEMILLNVLTLTGLSQLYLQDMLGKKEGIIINMASTAAFQPTPHMSVYGATKAFVLSFTEALWAEYRKSGIKILAVCPGPVDTGFFDVMGTNPDFAKKRETPEHVVKCALKALESNNTHVITGSMKNYWVANLSRFVPRKWVARVTERVMR